MDTLKNINLDYNIRMRLLSIDVGLKNLALCLFQKEDGGFFSIQEWDVINITGIEADNEVSYKCNEILKNGRLCNKNAKYILHSQEKCVCVKHSTNCNIQPSELTNLTKYNVIELKSMIEKYNITRTNGIETMSKKQMIDEIKKWKDMRML